MVSINYSSREVSCKIVYYGPGLSGKTTNLQYVHAKVPGKTRGELISLATEADRTLYFDFLPINIGTINGFAAKFQLYTVPGQVYYNATRKLVLRGVDGVVFVADSQPDKMDENIESLMNLEENLKEYGYDPGDLPIVIQYNKRDLPGVLSVDQLQAQLNSRGWPCFEASATVGNGVFDTLKLIIKLVLDKAKGASAAPPPKASTEMVGSKAPAAPVPPVAAQPVANQPVAAQPVAAQPIAPSPPAAAQPAAPAPLQEPAPVQAAPPAPQPVAAQAPAPEPPAPQAQAPQPSREEAYRPYPGETGGVAQVEPRKVSPTSFAAVPTAEETDDTLAASASVDNSNGDEDKLDQMVTPTMAPPLKRRGGKKRGFFKRLFGIK